MLLAPLLLALVQAPSAPVATAALAHGPGRAFVSPMGEPFFGRTASEDGLVVWFEQADRNHDGVLTVDEFTSDADRFFKVIDRNHDGEIDPDDISYYEETIVPEFRVQTAVSMTSLPGGDTQEHADDESPAGRFGLLQIPEPVTSADTNFDRGVSPREFRTAAVARFQLLDVDRQGKLSLSQLQNIRSAARNFATHRRNGGSSPSDNATSAEYGTPPRQP